MEGSMSEVLAEYEWYIKRARRDFKRWGPRADVTIPTDVVPALALQSIDPRRGY